MIKGTGSPVPDFCFRENAAPRENLTLPYGENPVNHGDTEKRAPLWRPFGLLIFFSHKI